MAAYATSTDVRQYLGVTSTSDSALMTALVLRAQTAIDNFTRRTFASTGNTTRRFTVGKDTDGRKLYFDRDLITVNAIVNLADSTATETVSTGHYITMPRNTGPYYGVELRSNSTIAWDYETEPEMGITVSGKWGYSTVAPADIKHACVRLAAYFYRQKDAQVFDVTASPATGQITVPQGVPADVKLILAPYVRPLMSVSLAYDDGY